MKYSNKILIRWASAVLLGLATTTGAAQNVHISHCQSACPSGAANSNEIVVRHLFVASINQQHGLADWIGYRVLQDSVGVASLLARYWQQDDLLPGESPYLQSDETRPGFTQPDLSDQPDLSYRINEILIDPEDRGRLVPMSSFAGTPYWDELNYLSNMSPLPVDLRTGSWSRLDQAINELAARIGEVYVLTGPLYQIQQPLDSNLTSATNLPSAYFKVILTETAHAAFIFQHDLAPHRDYCDQRTALGQIEQLSGLRLVPGQQTSMNSELHSELGCADTRK
jgi:endonuclease G